MKRGVFSVLSALAGAAAGAALIGKRMLYKKLEIQKMSDKHMDLFLMMNQWVKVKQQGKSIGVYLEEKGFNRIAIYGMSFVGETLLDELKMSHIVVAYCIDKNAKDIYTDMRVITSDEPFDEVDVIVVTAVTYFDEIKEILSDKVNCPVVSLEDILYEI